MDLIISYDSQLNLLCLEVSGCLTVENYQMSLQKILGSNDYSCDVKILWDLTEVEFNNAELDLMVLQKEISERLAVKRGFHKVALVSNKQHHESHIKSYIELLCCVTKGLSQHAKIFKTIDEAMYWLVYCAE